MRPSARSPPRDDVPSSPSSAWSATRSWSPGSATQGRLSPLTPESRFSPAPTIVNPDKFALQLDVQLDRMMAGSPRKSSVVQLFPPSDDNTEVQNRDWEDRYDQFPSFPDPRPRNPHCLPSQDSVEDAFSWDAAHPALVDPKESFNLSRCSRLIHEVSLLVGLAPDDDNLSPGDRCPLAPGRSTQIHDILPLNLTPTKSLSSRKHKNASLACPTNTDVQVHTPRVPVLSCTDNANTTPQSDKPPSVGSGQSVTPVPRQKSADVVRPSLSSRRRQGQVFHFQPPLSNAHRWNAVGLDETFVHPREPPPKPTPNASANRCSSLDRLECSLRKLEAHAPGSHRKSQSEGQFLSHVAQRKDKRPSLPPLRHLKKQKLNYDVVCCDLSRPTVDDYPSCPPPVPRPIPPYGHSVPRNCPVVPLGDDHREGDHTPGSFMDMDIPLTEEVSQKRQTSFRQVASKEAMMGLVRVARRMSRGVIAWGKNLAGSTKPPVTGRETTTAHGGHV